MDKVFGYLFGFVFVLALGLGLGIPIILFQGKVMYDMWEWFIAPNFGVSLSYLASCGIMIIFSLLVTVPAVRGYEEDKLTHSIGNLLRPVLSPLTLWAMGAIFKFWIF